MLSKDLLEAAVQFHGHLGPFLILGLRAGLVGVGYLGKDYFELSAKVKTASQPPRSCFVDGIQFTSGCTVGKKNLEQVISERVAVEFTRMGKGIIISVKDDILEAINNLMSENQTEIMSRELLLKTDEELFCIIKK